MAPEPAPGTLAICTVVKDEAPYLLEWIAYYLLHGADHFRIYDNDSTDGTTALLMGLAEHYPVERIPWPSIEGRSPQHTALEDAHRALAGRYAFTAVLDPDEFLFCTDGSTIRSWFANLAPDISAVGVNQRIFGSSGETEFRPEFVTTRFTHRKPVDDQEHHYVKTIARSARVTHVNAHTVELDAGRYIHCDGTDLVLSEARSGRAERIVAGPLRMNHYMLKSAGEFEIKRLRGGGTGTMEAVRRRRYGADFFALREQQANREYDPVLLPEGDRLRALVTDIAAKIGHRVRHPDLADYYAFLPRPAVATAGAIGRRPRLYIHVGIHKTGTTSLQHHLVSRRAELAASGLLVPESGIPRNYDGHHLLAWDLSGQYADQVRSIDRNALWNDLRAELTAHDRGPAIVSSEDFSILTDGQVDRLAELLDGIEIVPIIVLRNPADVLEGVYRTHVVSGGSHTLDEFAGDRMRQHDHIGLLLRWRRIAHEGRIIVASYDDPTVRGDIVQAVLSWIDHGGSAGATPPRLNAGLPAALIEIARTLRESGVDRAAVDGWLVAMSRLPFGRAQISAQSFLPADRRASMDADHGRQLAVIETSPTLQPYLRSTLPRPQGRSPRVLTSLADALLELPGLLSGTVEPGSSRGWTPRRLLPESTVDAGVRSHGHLDAPGRSGGRIVVAGLRTVPFGGWAFDAEHRDAQWYLVLRPLDATIASDQLFPLVGGSSRPDVASAFPDHREIAGRSGFAAAIDVSSLARGRYQLRLGCLRPDGLAYAPDLVELSIGVP